MPKSVQDLIAEAKAQIDNLSVDEVEAEIADGATLIDIRESEELASSGKIPGSIHIPRGVLEMKTGDIDPSSRVILHCAAGARSALGVVSLRELGFDNIAHLDGGFGAWEQAGRPIERG